MVGIFKSQATYTPLSGAVPGYSNLSANMSLLNSYYILSNMLFQLMWTAINMEKTNNSNNKNRTQHLKPEVWAQIPASSFHGCYLTSVPICSVMWRKHQHYFLQCHHADATSLHIQSAKPSAPQLCTGLMLSTSSLPHLRFPCIGRCGCQRLIALFTCVCSLWGEKNTVHLLLWGYLINRNITLPTEI